MRDFVKFGFRASNEDLTALEYSGEEQIAILIEALLRLGASMTASRAAISQLLSELEVSPVVILRPDESPEAVAEIDVGRESEVAQSLIAEVAEQLSQALQEIRSGSS